MKANGTNRRAKIRERAKGRGQRQTRSAPPNLNLSLGKAGLPLTDRTFQMKFEKFIIAQWAQLPKVLSDWQP